MADEDVSKKLSTDKQAVTDISNTIKEALSPIKTLSEALGLMVAHADKLNKSFGLGRARIEEMKVAFTDAAAGVEKLGGTLDDVSNTIIEIANASNRNVIENEKVISQLYAASKVLSITTEKLVDNFKDVGYETSQIGTNLESSIEYIQSVGLNATAVMKDVSENMGKMNRYQFEGGVQGLAKMAAQASMLRFDMKETFQFAEKVLTPEGAIETAAGIQRLGVSMGALADPFALMNASINDPSGLQDSLIKATKQFTEYDEKTKSFKINPQGVLTLRELAKETNTSFENLSKSALAAADLDKRLSKINPTLTFDSPEDKQFIANMATMSKEDGDYVVQLKNDKTGEVDKIKLSEITNEQLIALRKQQEEAPKTLEEIQKSQLNALLDIKYAIEGNVAKGTYGLAGSTAVRGNLVGAERISRAVTGAVDTAVPESVAITEKVNVAIDKMSALFLEKDANKISSDDFAKKLASLEDTILKDANSLGQKGMEAFKDILQQSNKKVKGSSPIEKEFRNFTSEILGAVGRPVSATEHLKKKAEEEKTLSYADIIGRRNESLTEKTNAGSSTNNKTSTSKVDVGGTITFKFDLPAGTTLNQQQLNAAFNSEEFRQYIANLAKQNSSENKGSGAPYYGR
jgi:hypothetical protein